MSDYFGAPPRLRREDRRDIAHTSRQLSSPWPRYTAADKRNWGKPIPGAPPPTAADRAWQEKARRHPMRCIYREFREPSLEPERWVPLPQLKDWLPSTRPAVLLLRVSAGLKVTRRSVLSRWTVDKTPPRTVPPGRVGPPPVSHPEGWGRRG